MSAALPLPTTWTTGSTATIRTGTWRAAVPRHVVAPSPCHLACPVGGEIADWMGNARAGDFRRAWQILTRHNPFPAIAGRVCHHPCETPCNRGAYDEPLAICKLERFVGDLALGAGWTFRPPAIEHEIRVAVVGGGPSGLSAAYQLRRRGIAVTLFEAREDLGGLMRHGIPGYRLPRTVLDAEIARVIALGIDVRCGVPVESPDMLEALRAGYDAVYLAVGAGVPKRLPQFDRARPWLVDGAQYLRQVNAGATPALGRRIVVVGGGSAALDVARSARRAGHDVVIVALESVGHMPAQADEIQEAIEEGILLCDAAMLTGAVEEETHGVALGCVGVSFSPGPSPGQFAVTPIEGSDFVLAADAVISAIGQDPDLSLLKGVLAVDAPLVRVDAMQATSAERVYAGGDVASTARFVTVAIGMGERAAQAIERTLIGSGAAHPVEPLRDTTESVVRLEAINTFYYPREPRVTERRLLPQARLSGDAEVQAPLDLDDALREAGRCFSCGVCIGCDNCVAYCPDLAIERIGGADLTGYRVLLDYCKGCGLCVRECPTGSMIMEDEAR